MKTNLIKLRDFFFENLFFESLIVVGIFHFIFHTSNWWWITPFVVLVVYLFVAFIPQFGFLRFMVWPATRRQVMTHFKNPLNAYPMLIWLELKGKQEFIKGGQRQFQIALLNKVEDYSQKLHSLCDAYKKI